MTATTSHTDTRVERFAAKATPLGSTVHQVVDMAALVPLVAQAAAERGATEVYLSDQIATLAIGFVDALTTAGLTPIVVSDRDGARDQPIGLTLAARAVVETGSVLLDERTIETRASSIMTLHNITVVPMDRLIDSLDDAASVLRSVAGRPGGGYASFVTGPSRTADIEMSLTVGVQGPAEVTIVFVDRLTESGTTL